MKSIQAINDMIIVEEVIKTEELSSGGIVLPATIKVEPQKYGKVLSVGEKVTNVKVDDIIVFHQAGGQALYMNGVVGRTLKNDEVYGILK